ncbi:MAG: glycosyltransferase [Kiritimatiellae bacterium]|nr:glycosyltransferase [Kiritimatiellia bacterium]
MTESTQAIWASAHRQVGAGLLSVVMPAHNEGAHIAANVETVNRLLKDDAGLTFELLVVDDGSTDDTRAELGRVAPQVPALKVVALEENRGKGSALRAGFEASRGDWVVFLDADLDLPAEQIAGLFDVLDRERADVVIGSKRHPDSVLRYPWLRRVMSTVYFWLVRLLFGMPIHDTQTGIKLFKRATLAWAMPRILVKAFAFDLEILTLIHAKGYRIAEAPVLVDFKKKMGCIRPRSVYTIFADTLAVFYRLRILRYYQTIPDVQIPPDHPLVSVLIAYPAETEHLRQALAGLAAQTYPQLEIILLPDSATGAERAANTRELATGPLRPAAKRNIGIRHARGAIAAFLDDDAFPAKDWIERAVAHFSDPAVAGVGGPSPTPPTDSYLAQLSGRLYANFLVSGQYRYRYVPRRFRQVDDLPSCNLFVRMDVLRQLGGFKTEFWPGEDTYLCMQIVHELGKKMVYEPRAEVWHHRRRLFLPHLRQIGRYGLHRGYFARHFPATSRRLGYLLPSLFVLGVVLGGMLALVCRPCRLLYAGALAVYAGATLASTWLPNPVSWFLTWVGMVLTHLVYGTRFMAGFLTRRLPHEKQKFDHLSEERG